ncbi:MAG: 4-hydroxy-3-methylbut-2-enyl diphosphate reductase, partial [Alphaproteobacteria bacterium]|nr:4-hydroxy-3-methylbut-2-enyl diphosphate reductase [Alphaproteobacteria bacterium]
MTARKLTILLAKPRGFCAGVERAIDIVEQALLKNGPPIYVRHEIVHNKHVVDGLKARGAVFVEELDDVPDNAIVVFSAHGVPKAVPSEARRRQLIYADATCPLVSKVHRGVEQHHKAGRTVLLIGHEGHPEVIGTMGQLPEGAVRLVENVEQALAIEVDDPEDLAYATQTT